MKKMKTIVNKDLLTKTEVYDLLNFLYYYYKDDEGDFRIGCRDDEAEFPYSVYYSSSSEILYYRDRNNEINICFFSCMKEMMECYYGLPDKEKRFFKFFYVADEEECLLYRITDIFLIKDRGSYSFSKIDIFKDVILEQGVALRNPNKKSLLEVLKVQTPGGLRSAKDAHDGGKYTTDYPFKKSYQANNAWYAKNINDIFQKEFPIASKRFTGHGFTYGIEYETSVGTIPAYLLGKVGLIPLRDGSLPNGAHEYASVVMKEHQVLDAIDKQCGMLGYFCEYDSNCAVHFHIGIPEMENRWVFLLKMYKQLLILEKEIFSMIPRYKRDEVSIMKKSKNYSDLMDWVDFSGDPQHQYAQLISTLNSRELSETYRRMAVNIDNIDRHSPIVPWRRKWNCPTRYRWANFVNAIIERGPTIEFRFLEPTFNKHLLKGFLLLMTKVMEFCLENKYNNNYLYSIDDLLNNLNQNQQEPLRVFVDKRKRAMKEIVKKAAHLTIQGASYLSSQQDCASFVLSVNKRKKMYNIELKSFYNEKKKKAFGSLKNTKKVSK